MATRKKSGLGNKKFRSVSNPLYEVHANPNSKNGLKSPTHLLYKSEDKNSYSLRNTNTLISIVGLKITITTPDVHTCVSYIITKCNCHPSVTQKRDHLQVDVLAMKKL